MASSPRRWSRGRLIFKAVALLVVAGAGAYAYVRWQASQPAEYPPRAWKDEIARWEKVAADEPGNDRAWQRLGQLYSRTGETDRAVQAWSKALESQPDNRAGWDRLARAYTDQGTLDEAARCHERVLELMDGQPPRSLLLVQRELTSLYLELDEPDQARAHAEAAAATAEALTDQRLAQGHYEQLGICLWALDRRDEAKTWFDRASRAGSDLATEYLERLAGGEPVPEEYTHQVTARRKTVEETEMYEGRPELPPNPPLPPWEMAPPRSP